MSAKTLRLIEDYIRRVRRLVHLLQEHYGVTDLLLAARDRRVPKHARLDNHELTFTFHGVGCRVEESNVIVDFDFGPGGIVGGFDSWRLLQFLQSCSDYDSSKFSQDSLESDLQELIVSRLVLSPKHTVSPHLLYLAKDDD